MDPQQVAGDRHERGVPSGVAAGAGRNEESDGDEQRGTHWPREATGVVGTSQADSAATAALAVAAAGAAPQDEVAGNRRRRGEYVPGGRFISRTKLGARALYWLAALIVAPRGRASVAVLRELDVIGVAAVRLVIVAGLLVGIIATFQVATQLAQYSAEMMSARAIGWFTARELGPLMVAILIISRSAAKIAGELATMSAGGEIDALRAMGLDPIKYLVAPKLAALIIALPALTIVADATIAVGGWVGNTAFLGFTTGFYLEQFRRSFENRDLFVGLVKAVIFAVVIGLVAADEGLSVRRRIASIGDATTRAVVLALVAVLAVDTIVNAMFYFIPGLL